MWVTTGGRIACKDQWLPEGNRWSLLWHWWLVDRQHFGTRKTECWSAGDVDLGANIHVSWVHLKRCVDKLSKSTYPSLAPITVFVISGLQSVIYWKNFCHVWWVSYGLYVSNCICTLMRAVFWHTCTFSGYINRLCRHSVESDCVSWIYCPIIC